MSSSINVEKMQMPAFVNRLSGMLDSFDETLSKTVNTDQGADQDLAESRKEITELLERKLGQSLEKVICISKLPDEDWSVTVRHILDDVLHPMTINNFYDGQFVFLVKHIMETDEETLLNDLKKALEAFASKHPDLYNDFIEYHKHFTFWGTLAPEIGDFTALLRRVEAVKRHIFDLIWLYKRLDDYLSKTTFTSILFNWIYLDMTFPQTTKSCFADYWDPDIFPECKNEVLVDVGAFEGDSIAKFIQIYGRNYKKIFAYEISPESTEKLRNNAFEYNWHDVTVFQKGAGETHDNLYLRSSADPAANSVSNVESAVKVEVVPLDDEVGKEATFIKMDIEGAEQSALKGLKKTISSRHPKLAVCTYHGYEDIWKVPYLIDKMYSGYKFYFRHYGGNILPTEFVLLCK